MSNGGGIVTSGFGSSGEATGGGVAEQVIQGQVLPVLEKLEDVVENAMNELNAKGLGLKAVHTRLLEVIDKVFHKQPDYYLLDIDKMSSDMKILIGLRRSANERNNLD